MTTREFIQAVDNHPRILIAVFVALPLLAWVCGRIHGKGRAAGTPWRYVYSVLVYAACIPGLFAAVLTAYALFFTRENLLDASLLVYALPIVSMIVTLVAIRRNIPFEAVPGFDRLSGLMMMIGLSFAVALAIDKTRIWIWFGGSIQRLLLLAAGVFALLKWGFYMLFRGRDEPPRRMPGLPLTSAEEDTKPTGYDRARKG
ncbi:MAG: hypothetical protein BWZ02_00581 [Lentisphaerae bacterium ADurb.BinA184]|nr:MAG: hypothetical protein BWZ02_00581 [Lentisphaerae bacterium ADurb.BinA184]